MPKGPARRRQNWIKSSKHGGNDGYDYDDDDVDDGGHDDDDDDDDAGDHDGNHEDKK